MKKLVYIVLVIVMIASCSQEQQAKTTVDDTLPEYDVIPHCRKFADQFKKYDIEDDHYSNRVFNDCLQEERTDYEWLKTNWSTLSSKAKILCKQAAGDPDENYSDLKVCARAVTCEDDDDNLEICAGQKKLKDILGH